MREACDVVCDDTLDLRRVQELSATIDWASQYTDLAIVPFIAYHHILMGFLGIAIVFYCKSLVVACPM